jgi:hypothetical protein
MGISIIVILIIVVGFFLLDWQVGKIFDLKNANPRP